MSRHRRHRNALGELLEEVFDDDFWKRPLEHLQKLEKKLSSDHESFWAFGRRRRQEDPPPPASGLSCSDCSRDIPTGFTFCIHCGGEAHYHVKRIRRTLRVTGFDQPDAADALGSWLATHTDAFSADAARRALDDPPAEFVFAATDAEARLTVDSLRGMGVLAEVDRRRRGPSAAFERGSRAVPRNPVLAASMVAAIGGFGALMFVSTPVWVIAMMATVAAIVLRANHLEVTQPIPAHKFLPHIQGLDEDLVGRIRAVQSGLGNEEVRSCLKICLLEYQAMGIDLRAMEQSLGRAVSDARVTLARMMESVVDAAERYVRLEAFAEELNPAVLRDQIASLEQRALQETNPTIAEPLFRTVAEKKSRLTTIQELGDRHARLHAEILGMTASVEALRARLLRVALGSRDDQRADQVDAAVNALGEQVDVLAETVEELETVDAFF